MYQIRNAELEKQKMQAKQLVPNLDWSKVGIGHDKLLSNHMVPQNTSANHGIKNVN